MTYLRCLTVQLVLKQTAPVLSHADRLIIESHLGECERCRRDYDAIVRLLALAEERVDGSMRSIIPRRALARALARTPARKEARASATAGGTRPSWATRLSLWLASLVAE